MEKQKPAQPSAPKRPVNAYMIYRAQVYDDLKKKNPDMKITEIAKLIGDQFRLIKRKLEGKEKEKLDNQAKKLKQQYEAEIAEYKKKYGELPKKSRSKSSEKKHSPKQKKEKQEKVQKSPQEQKSQKGKVEIVKDKKKK